MNKNKKELIGKLRQQRDKFIAKKNWAGVLIIINQLIEIEPTAKRLCKRAVVFLKLGCLTEALQSYQKALFVDPLFRTARKGIYDVTSRLDKYAEARGQLGSLRYQLTWLLLKEDWEGALVLAKRLLILEPTTLHFCHCAVLLIQLERYKEALEFYEKALAQNPQSDMAHRGLNKLISFLKKEGHRQILEEVKESEELQKWRETWISMILEKKSTDETDTSSSVTIMETELPANIKAKLPSIEQLSATKDSNPDLGDSPSDVLSKDEQERSVYLPIDKKSTGKKTIQFLLEDSSGELIAEEVPEENVEQKHWEPAIEGSMAQNDSGDWQELTEIVSDSEIVEEDSEADFMSASPESPGEDSDNPDAKG